LKNELTNITVFFTKYKSEVIVFSFATLFLTLAKYHPVGNYWFSSFIYYFLLPVLVTAISLRRNPLDFGLRIGNIKFWGTFVLLTCLILAPILLIGSRFSAFQKYYDVNNFNLIRYSFETIIYLLGWEYIFRGFLLFGLKDRFDEGSILVQMVPFVLLHFGKPELETYSTILTGILFGYICYRGNSFWPAFLIHLFINISFLALVNLM
jgi:uncharacterized protein